MTTVYVTKYALSQGIFPIEADIVDGYARELPRNTLGHFLSKNEYALTRNEAIRQAEERRIKKLKALDRQAKKISALNFEGMF